MTSMSKRRQSSGALELITVGPGRSVEATIQALKADPAVEYAEPNWIYTTQATSNDPYYTNGSLWGMYGDAHHRPANQYGSQAGEAWAAGHTGSQHRLRRHHRRGHRLQPPRPRRQHLDQPVRSRPTAIDNDGNGYVDDVHGWDFDGNRQHRSTTAPTDDHGTHVAGTIGGRGRQRRGRRRA